MNSQFTSQTVCWYLMKTADVILKVQVENELSVRDSSLYLADYVDTVSCVRRNSHSENL